MALHNLKIIVYDGGKAGDGIFSGSSNDKGESGTVDNKKSMLYKFLNYNSTIRNKVAQSTSPATFFAIQSGVQIATQTGREFINYYVSNIGRANGDSNYQAIVNRKIEKVTDALSLGQGALTGAASGAMAGPIGAAIGLVVGAVSSGINLGFKYAGRDREYQHTMFKENTSQAYQLARANYSAYTGRVR